VVVLLQKIATPLYAVPLLLLPLASNATYSLQKPEFFIHSSLHFKPDITDFDIKVSWWCYWACWLHIGFWIVIHEI